MEADNGSPLPTHPSIMPVPTSPRPPMSTNSPNDSDPSTPIAAPDEEDEDEDIPLTLAASVVLSDLPSDAASALAETVAAASAQEDKKVIIKFKAVGSAPSLAQDVCKISAARRFEEVVRYLRKKLRCKDTDSVFLYVNSTFAPSLDEVVGNLHQVTYCRLPQGGEFVEVFLANS